MSINLFRLPQIHSCYSTQYSQWSLSILYTVVWDLTKVRSQSFANHIFVVVVDFFMLTHCQQEKKWGRKHLAASLCLGIETKFYWTWSLFSTINWPIISEVAGECLKCEHFSLYTKPLTGNKWQARKQDIELTTFPSPTHFFFLKLTHVIGRYTIDYLSWLLSTAFSNVCVCSSCTQIPFTWSCDWKVGWCIINLCCLTFD